MLDKIARSQQLGARSLKRLDARLGVLSGARSLLAAGYWLLAACLDVFSHCHLELDLGSAEKRMLNKIARSQKLAAGSLNGFRDT